MKKIQETNANVNFVERNCKNFENLQFSLYKFNKIHCSGPELQAKMWKNSHTRKNKISVSVPLEILMFQCKKSEKSEKKRQKTIENQKFLLIKITKIKLKMAEKTQLEYKRAL